ncbi:hypothetical protein [Wukongibacter baidiensis]
MKDIVNWIKGVSEKISIEEKKIIAVIGILIFVIGIAFLTFEVLQDEKQGYDVETKMVTEDKLAGRKENVNKQGKEKEWTEGEIKNRELHIEANKPEPIEIKPMLDGTSGVLYSELKPLPLEDTLEEISIRAKKNDKVYPKTEKITSEIIKRLKSYPTYNYDGNGKISKLYVSFEDMYKNRKENCGYIVKSFSPSMVDIYKYGEVIWGTSPRLVYKTPIGQKAVRGIIQIKYYRANNPYDLKPFKWYERDVEYRLTFATEGKHLNKIVYLSNWMEVE